MAKKVIKFWASFCGPCRVYAPVFDKVKQELEGDIEFIDINVENDLENLSGKYRVKGIPHTVLLENQQEVKAHSGRMTEEQLKEFILN